jgi:hypothetical protein
VQSVGIVPSVSARVVEVLVFGSVRVMPEVFTAKTYCCPVTRNPSEATTSVAATPETLDVATDTISTIVP